MTTTSSERRLHPVGVLFDASATILRVGLPLVALLFTTARDGWALLVVGGGVGGIAFLSAAIYVLRYLRYTYQYDERELVIRSGVLSRNERRIPYTRIQNLDVARSLKHRLFGVAVVYVQTGAGEAPEATLRVLSLGAVEEMRTRVLAGGGALTGSATRATPDETLSAEATPLEPAEPVPDQQLRRTLLSLEPADLLLAGFIENRGMLLIAGAFAALYQADFTEPLIERLVAARSPSFERAGTYFSTITLIEGAAWLAALVLLFVLFIRALSTIWALVRLHGFRLERAGDDLHMQYGLFTRVTATIPLRRVQTIVVEERLLHRILGRVLVRVTTAGGHVAEGRTSLREPIAPILPAALLPALLHEVQPGLTLHGLDWRPVHRRAAGRMMRMPLFWSGVVAVATYFAIDLWAIAVFAILGAAAVLNARLRARYAGWTLTADSFIVRDGGLTRKIRIARFSRIQVTQLLRTPFDRRTGMSVVRADTAGAGAVSARFLPESAAASLHDELAAHTAQTGFSW